MGNICSRSSNKTDNFATPGRTLGSAPPQPNPSSSQARAPIPSGMGNSQSGQNSGPARASGPGRTLGGTSDGSSAPRNAAQDDERQKRLRAVEERTQPKPQGKIGEKLAAQQRQTQNQTLAQASREERGARVADENANMRSYN